jgi:hypothetical protein
MTNTQRAAVQQTHTHDDAVLSFDPFEGDFGDQGDVVFLNRMVVARKPGPCSHCGSEIQKGERVRRQTSKFDGALMTHRWCHQCCCAMATYDSDLEEGDLPEYERRATIAKATGETQ